MEHSKQVTKRWFGKWSNEYDKTLGMISFHKGVVDLAVKSSRVKDGDKVLDIGCGTGLLSLKFLQAADCTVTGIDNSNEMLAIFKGKICKLGLSGKAGCAAMDADAIKCKPDTFDIAASTFVLHHLKEKVAPIRKIYRALKPGGRFIIGEIDMDSTGSFTDRDRMERMIAALEEEWIHAIKDAGAAAFSRMYDNGKKHILNQGEYCISLRQWALVCRKAGFTSAAVKRLGGYRYFGVVVAEK